MLEVTNLSTHFRTPAGTIRAVVDVSFSVAGGEMLGVVGESGCGKSVMIRSIMRIIQSPPGEIVSGRICFKGRDLLDLSEREMRRVRGKEIAMIFQEPMTALNPKFTVGFQLAEVYRKHMGLGRREAHAESVRMLETVGIPAAARRMREYPFQMSGGMCQRVLIAMALATGPSLIVADEPTTALDVTIQAQILDLIRSLNERFGTSIILITHDLGVIAETVKRVLVMYAGQVVEQAEVRDLFDDPLHPYTTALLKSMPRIDGGPSKDEAPLIEIPGMVPDLANLPRGCLFQARCPRRMDKCAAQDPALIERPDGRRVRCWLYE